MKKKVIKALIARYKKYEKKAKEYAEKAPTGKKEGEMARSANEIYKKESIYRSKKLSLAQGLGRRGIKVQKKQGG